MNEGVLDESVPRPLARLLRARGLNVVPFPRDWRGVLNGRLLDLVEGHGYDVLITCDQSLPHQQNLSGRDLAIVVLSTNKMEKLSSALDVVAAAIDRAQAGRYVTVDAGR